LVLVGKVDKDEPEILQEIERINTSLKTKNYQLKTIIATGFIDEEELPLAYAGALAYCIPSLSEGFGLPPLEAMASGTPVIASKISAMPEILGDAPLCFDPYNVDDIAQAMQKIIEDKNSRDQLSKKGLEQVKKYNWQSTAEKTLKVYKEVL
jgi:glycosyltransferase involved in cell wall biosynthesis